MSEHIVITFNKKDIHPSSTAEARGSLLREMVVPKSCVSLYVSAGIGHVLVTLPDFITLRAVTDSYYMTVYCQLTGKDLDVT